MSEVSTRVDIDKSENDYVVKISNGTFSAEVRFTNAGVGFSPVMGHRDILNLLMIGFTGLIEDGKIPDPEVRAYYRQMIEVFMTSLFLGTYFRKRRYTSRKFLRSLEDSSRKSVLKSEVWRSLNGADNSLPFLDRLTKAIIDTTGSTKTFSDEDIQKALFTSMFKCKPSACEKPDFSIQSDLIAFAKRHSEWFNEIRKGPDAPLFSIGSPRHVTMISHKFRDLIHTSKDGQGEIFFFRLLYMSFKPLTSCFVYAVNEICRRLTCLSDFDDESRKIFSGLLFPQKWFGGTPLLIYLLYGPSPKQGRRKTSEPSILECVPPIFEMLHILGEWYEGFEPWQVHAVCQYYSWLNDMEINEIRANNIRIREESLPEDIQNSSSDGGREGEEIFFTYLRKHLKRKDYNLSVSCLEYVGNKSIPWGKIIKDHPEYGPARKLRDYWRKTVSQRLKCVLEKFLEGTPLEDEQLIRGIKSKIKSL